MGSFESLHYFLTFTIFFTLTVFCVLQISFRGKVQSKGQTIVAIDDVSFLPEWCEKIPFTRSQCKKPAFYYISNHLTKWKRVDLCTQTSVADQIHKRKTIRKALGVLEHIYKHVSSQGNTHDQLQYNTLFTFWRLTIYFHPSPRPKL